MFNFINCIKAFTVISLTAALISYSGNDRSADENDLNNFPDPDLISFQNYVKGGIVSYADFTTIPSAKTFVFGPETYYSLVDTFTIQANPGPPNNGGSPNWAAFLDLIAGPRNIIVTQMSVGSTGTAGASYSVEIFTRSGTALGGPVGSGPGSSTAGWTSIGTAPVTQGATASGISLVFNIPVINIDAMDTVGVAIKYNVVGPRYFGSGSPPYSIYNDTNLTVVTGDGRSTPFTTTGSWFASRAHTGVVRYVLGSPVGITNNGTEIPGNFRLSQNYPNPFNPSTTIEFAIPEKNNVTLKVYDANGREIAVLVDGNYNAGSYNVSWDAAEYSSGVYFYVLGAGGFTQTKKLVLLK